LRFLGPLSLTTSVIGNSYRLADRRVATRASREGSGESDDEASTHGRDRVWDVALGSDRRRLWVGNRRGLANLLGWLQEAAPDIVCLQELKAPDDKFPAAALHTAGYGAVWHGQKSWNGVAILARGAAPLETRRGLPGDPDDTHSRYIEAAIGGTIVGCLYLPNGNPAPGPKFDYKLRWFERLTSYAKMLLDSGAPAVLAGDFNVMPTDLDVYAPERWVDDALFRPDVREAYRRLVAQGWTDALRALHPDERIYTFWKYFRNA
jgi:exodeoxyribonuclease-3